MNKKVLIPMFIALAFISLFIGVHDISPMDIINFNTEKINILYSVASNLETPNSPEMNQVIELCIEDIKLAKKYKQYCLEDDKIFNRSNDLPIYQSFKRLVII